MFFLWGYISAGALPRTHMAIAFLNTTIISDFRTRQTFVGEKALHVMSFCVACIWFYVVVQPGIACADDSFD